MWTCPTLGFAVHSLVSLKHNDSFCRMDENENDVTLDVSLSESNEILWQAITSTPKHTGRPSTTGQLHPNALFKAPLPPPTPQRFTATKRKPPPPKKTTAAKSQRKKNNKPELVCNDCGKQYVNMGYFNNHCRTHAILGMKNVNYFFLFAPNVLK